MKSPVLLHLVVACVLSAAPAADLTTPMPFVPVITPQGYSKKQTLILQGNGMAILDAQGGWTPLGRYLYDLARDPALVEAHVRHLLNAPDNWPVERSPLFSGPNAVNQGHRLLRQLTPFVRLVRAAPQIPQPVKDALLPAGWQDTCEAVFRKRMNADGLMAEGGHVTTMALSFHFLRTGWGAMGLRPERIYTLEHAQHLVRHLLTCPYIINDQDRWLPVDEVFLKRFAVPADQDPLLVKDGTALFTGGLFIGWKTTMPSLHATWDGLAIINTLFAFHPEPDPAKPGSIFHRWAQETPERRAIAQRTFALLIRRLWSDHHTRKGASWCRIVGGKVTASLDGVSDGEQVLDHAGYTRKDMTSWAAACWQEVYGHPARNTTNGVQALLAILDGRVLTQLQQATGDQKRSAEDDED